MVVKCDEDNKRGDIAVNKDPGVEMPHTQSVVILTTSVNFYSDALCIRRLWSRISSPNF